MHWPHDPDGEQGSEGGRKYDLAILAKRLDEEGDFPLSIPAFVDEHGDEPLRVDHGRVISVRELFEHADAAEAETIVEFHQIAGRAMRAGGFRRYAPGSGEHA
jgi:hypothetical protein